MRNTVVTLCVGLLVLVSSAAYAQDQRQIGVTLGYPASIGIVWHATDRIAVRPGISSSRSWSESISETPGTSVGLNPPVFFSPTLRTTTTTESWSIGVDLSVLVYVNKWDNVRTYLAPSYGDSRVSSSSETLTEALSPIPPGFPPTLFAPRSAKGTSASHAGRAVFGVQFTPHRRFAVSGEGGIRYSQSGDPLIAVIETSTSRRFESHSLGMTAGVGVILYLK